MWYPRGIKWNCRSALALIYNATLEAWVTTFKCLMNNDVFDSSNLVIPVIEIRSTTMGYPGSIHLIRILQKIIGIYYSKVLISELFINVKCSRKIIWNSNNLLWQIPSKISQLKKFYFLTWFLFLMKRGPWVLGVGAGDPWTCPTRVVLVLLGAVGA